MMRKIAFITGSLAAALCLSACDGVGNNAREVLGLGKKTPDEFRVVSRPPLTVPQDFTLRPPQEGVQGSNLPPAHHQARATVIGESLPQSGEYDYTRKMGPADTAVGIVSSYDLKSTADESFLGNIGVKAADPEIRKKLYVDHKEVKEKKEDKALFDWLVPAGEDEVLVDAEAEKKRLETNAKAGKDVTEGETPTLEKKQKGLLEGLFN